MLDSLTYLNEYDSEVAKAIGAEEVRQQNTLELIASENFVSLPVMIAQGSVLTNKYAEGYPGRRYYGGCKHYDEIENIAIERAKSLFGAEYANMQPHSGTQANMAVYQSLLNPGDTVLTMDMASGGHLSHGSRVSSSGRLYNVVHYGVERDTGLIDMNEVWDRAKACLPRLIVAGASSYSRFIDFGAFREICDLLGAYLMVDMAHIAGLVAAGVHPSPVSYADVVTSTTHKTMRGPRGGFILCKEKYGKIIDKQIFPGTQGGPLMHTIAAKAVALKMAASEGFKFYQKQVTINAKTLAECFMRRNFDVVTKGTDNHMFVVDLRPRGSSLTGARAESLLEEARITVNKNVVPFDTRPANVTSGIRIGTPAITTRGMLEDTMHDIANIMAIVLDTGGGEEVVKKAVSFVLALAKKYPIPIMR